MKKQAEAKRGDKSKLDRDQRILLETKIIPTARRWLTEYPDWKNHAEKTLEYWGEKP